MTSESPTPDGDDLLPAELDRLRDTLAVDPAPAAQRERHLAAALAAFDEGAGTATSTPWWQRPLPAVAAAVLLVLLGAGILTQLDLDADDGEDVATASDDAGDADASDGRPAPESGAANGVESDGGAGESFGDDATTDDAEETSDEAAPTASTLMGDDGTRAAAARPAPRERYDTLEQLFDDLASSDTTESDTTDTVSPAARRGLERCSTAEVLALTGDEASGVDIFVATVDERSVAVVVGDAEPDPSMTAIDLAECRVVGER